jgi:hypothetical protein
VRVCAELAHIAFASVGDVYYPNGKIKAMAELDPETKAAIKSVRKTRKKQVDGQLVANPYHFYDKMPALVALGHLTGLLPPRAGRRPGSGNQLATGPRMPARKKAAGVTAFIARHKLPVASKAKARRRTNGA